MYAFLVTCVIHNLPLIVVVCDNDGWMDNNKILSIDRVTFKFNAIVRSFEFLMEKMTFAIRAFDSCI
jgi:hypothetical protein